MQEPPFSNNLTIMTDAGHLNGVIACVDRSRSSHMVASYSAALANTLKAPLTLLQVLEAGPAGTSRPDPLEWDLRRQDAQASIKPIAARCGESSGLVDAAIVEGHVAEQICLWADDHGADLIVLGTHGEERPIDGGLGHTAHTVLDRSKGSVLLIPPLNEVFANGNEVRFKRFLVPVDGSSRAESVLPMAIRLARAAQAEIVIAYVIPVPELIENGPLESDDIELRERVICRNERVAGEYLACLYSRIARNGLRIRTMVLRDSDVRSRLIQLSADEKAELIILSAHGHSGRTNTPYGSVTAHLIAHSRIPVLIVRNPLRAAEHPRSQVRLKANSDGVDITSLSA